MRAILLSAALAAICLPGWAADPKTDNVNPDEIIKKFAAKEAEFARRATTTPTARRVKLEVLDSGGNPTGGIVDRAGRYHLLAGRQAHGEGDVRARFDSASTSC